MANTNKKPTIVENFKDLIEVLEANGLLTDARKEFLEKRIEVTEKKNASGGEKKLTKAQEANEGYKSAILAEMEKGKENIAAREAVIVGCENKIKNINAKLTDLVDRVMRA